MKHVLKVEHLTKIYKGRKVVDDLSLLVQSGEVVGLLGPNGAGKTTTFYMMVGIIKPNSGNVVLDNKDITSLPMYQRARIGLHYLPQEASVFRKMTVEENILAILETLNLSRSEMEDRLQNLLKTTGYGHPYFRPQCPRNFKSMRPGIYSKRRQDIGSRNT